MSGCLLAYAVLKLSPSVKVILIDENPQRAISSSHPGFDARSIALSAGSCLLFEQLGLWSALKEQAQAIDDIHISDLGYGGTVDLVGKENAKPFGYVVELQNIGALLTKQLAGFAQLTRLYESRFTAIEKQPEQVICELENGQKIRAKLCVAADGADSLTRELLAIDAQTSDYQCSAIIANVSCAKDHLNKAYERFSPSGPIALLPLTENRFSLVWSVENGELVRLLQLNNEEFLAELQQTFGYRAGIFRKIGKRDSYPLKLLKTDKAVTHRGVCIGNAAHCLHPIMGQGFNLGMRDLYVLARLISQVEDSAQLGDYQMLNNYWSARQKDQQQTICMTDATLRIFSNRSWPVVAGRNIALHAMSCFSGLSTPIVKQAKGQFNLFKRNSIR